MRAEAWSLVYSSIMTKELTFGQQHTTFGEIEGFVMGIEQPPWSVGFEQPCQ